VKITNYDDEYTNLKTVNKKDISYFATNPREIWKNISIKEVYNGKKIDGFKVMWIKPGSKFAQLGLKKGDIIIKANNKRLTSYKDAIDIYTNISRLKEVQITVLRDNDEKEFIYEIN
jgi:type II secretion system protein C